MNEPDDSQIETERQDAEEVVAASDAGPFLRLLAVQDLDTSISQLERRKTTLAERVELHAVEAKLAELDATLATVDAQRQELVAKQAELEEDIGAINDRRKVIEGRMYGSTGTAGRDLQAMDEEVHHLTTRRAALEEVELELMERQEPLDADLLSLHAERDPLEVAAGELRTAVAAAELVVQAELGTVTLERELQASRLPDELRERYERFRVQLKGTGAARLVGNHCDGCHLELPSQEVDRIRHLPADVLVTCEQCGRILVRGGAPR